MNDVEVDGHIEVRPASPADAEAIASIAREVHEAHATAHPGLFQPGAGDVMSRGEVETLVASASWHLLVAVRSRAVVGYATAEEQRTPASPYKRERAVLHVHAMAVASAVRGAGVGRALMHALRELAGARGLRTLELQVYEFNAAARRFYEREGFAPLRTLMTSTSGEPAS